MDKYRFETSSSTSRCVTTSDQTTHNFEVTDFSLLEGMGAGKYVSSRIFTAGGRHWNIRLYPDGWKEEDEAAYVSVFLCFVRGAKDPRTKYTLSLLEKDEQISELSICSTTMLSKTLVSSGAFWGFDKFVEKSKLKPLLRLSGDRFTIRCVLTVIEKSQSHNVVSTMVVPPSNMLQHFEQMLKDGKGMDVAFDVGGQLFHAHRCVLAARSPVFQAELFGPMKEKDTAPIKVDDMEPCVFEELLHFIYTDQMSDKCAATDKTAAMQQHLLVAADRYGLERLRLMCEVKLCRDIDVQTVAATLALADQHHCMRLKDACLTFVASGDHVLAAVKKTDGFKHLVASCPLVTLDILDKIDPKAKSR